MGRNTQNENHWKKFERDNLNCSIAVNILHTKKEKKYPAYVSKHNSNCEK